MPSTPSWSPVVRQSGLTQRGPRETTGAAPLKDGRARQRKPPPLSPPPLGTRPKRELLWPTSKSSLPDKRGPRPAIHQRVPDLDKSLLLRRPREATKSRRQEQRVRDRDAIDESLLSKYLPDDLQQVFRLKIQGPDDQFSPPKWFERRVREVFDSPAPPPQAPPVKFAVDSESLESNANLLERYDYDVENLIGAFQKTTLGHGSEFRPIPQLAKILSGHPHFPFFRQILSHGMDYSVVEELTPQAQSEELHANLLRGNHKSATSDPETTKSQLHKDVKHGFSMPFPADRVTKLVGAQVQPCGLARQFALQANGSRVLKSRLTHDLSYEITRKDASVNNRIDMERYPEMIFGWCLPRIIHFVVALRAKYPTTSILICKYDFSDAYRRVSHSGKAAAQSIIVFDDVAYLALRLSFGGAPNPPTWCAFSEMVTDLSNELSLSSWEPGDFKSPDQPSTPAPKLEPATVAFVSAKETAVGIPIWHTARSDDFIDDIIRVFLDTARNREREPHVVPLSVFVTSRPHGGYAEPVPRRSNLSGPKLAAEGTPAEVQIVLGWTLNTRRLSLALPYDKFVAWSSDLSQAIRDKRATLEQLMTLVGRLNHAAHVIPLARHFLSRLHDKSQSDVNRKQHLRFTRDELLDLKLWEHFLQQAHDGISLNLLTIRTPTKLSITDSCPFGMGGFSWTGRAWRVRIPPESPLYGRHQANNILEFLALAVGLWLLVKESADDNTTEECLMALADNTSAVGWVFRSSRLSSESWYHEPVQLVARKVAMVMISSGNCLCTQHLTGSLNTVADYLSFSHQCREGSKINPLAYDDPPDDILTNRFHSHLSQLVPQGFAICPLPDDVLSFVGLVLRTAESSWTRRSPSQTTTKPESGTDGQGFATPPTPWTLSSLVFQNESVSSSSGRSWKLTSPPSGPDQATFLDQIRRPWRQRLSEQPQATWLRRFGCVSNAAPFTSRTAPSACNPPSGPC